MKAAAVLFVVALAALTDGLLLDRPQLLAIGVTLAALAGGCVRRVEGPTPAEVVDALPDAREALRE